MVVGVGGNGSATTFERSRSCSATCRTRRPARRAPASVAANGARCSVHAKDSDQAHLILGVPSYPIAHPDRYALQLLAHRARRRHVLAALHRGAGAARARVLRLRANHGYIDAGTLYSQAGVDVKRVDEAVDDDRPPSCADRGRAGARRRAREGANLAKGRFVLRSRARRGLIMFGLRREVLEGQATEPAEVLAGLDAVTAEDVQRVGAGHDRRARRSASP